MSTIKLESVDSNTFLVGGVAYQKGFYKAEYVQTATDNTTGVITTPAEALVLIKPLTYNGADKYTLYPFKVAQPWTSFVDSTGTAYASFDAFTKALIALMAPPSNSATNDLVNDKGTVTQITSKTTGVTSNTLNTVITTVALTDAADASFSFTFTNSKIASTSNIQITCLNSGNGLAVATVTSIAGGSAVVKVTNAGTASFNSLIKLHVLVA